MKYLIVFFISLICNGYSFAGGTSTNFLTVGTSRTRPLAMGSAYNSIQDDFTSGFYNPSAFKVNPTQDERPYRFFLKPVSPIVAFYDYDKYNRDFEKDDKLTLNEGLYAASMIFKGAVLSTEILDMGIGLNEEIILDDSSKVSKGRLFSVEGISKYSFNSFFLNFKISEPVIIGLSGNLYHSRINGKSSYEGGYTAGVLLVPNPKLNVGLVYNKIPDKFSNARTGLEYIENEAISSGISYHPDDKTVISLDIRNLNKEDAVTSREIHTGFERTFFERIALRGGYYRKKTDESNVFSFGIGILPEWVKIEKYSKMTRMDLFSYTFVTENDGDVVNWHIISLLLKY